MTPCSTSSRSSSIHPQSQGMGFPFTTNAYNSRIQPLLSPHLNRVTIMNLMLQRLEIINGCVRDHAAETVLVAEADGLHAHCICVDDLLGGKHICIQTHATARCLLHIRRITGTNGIPAFWSQTLLTQYDGPIPDIKHPP